MPVEMLIVQNDLSYTDAKRFYWLHLLTLAESFSKASFQHKKIPTYVLVYLKQLGQKVDMMGEKTKTKKQRIAESRQKI